ncbi:FosA family fosfomycin resistance glutathione transferase [Salmonella enterica subsp. enterica serovar Choleraesuis]|nr:FosA family fosfomycin resistance glutathione transferase [Salmonella enterica subsp. enterica serovar Choleraesuis]
MLQGINHLTFAVRDVGRSIAFYHRLLGMELHARWAHGAYLSCGETWICLSEDNGPPPPENYSHCAFSISAEAFPSMVARLQEAQVKVWRENRSEGASFYFCCPDGHRLELHVGDLASRLAACRDRPYQDMTFYNSADSENKEQ